MQGEQAAAASTPTDSKKRPLHKPAQTAAANKRGASLQPRHLQFTPVCWFPVQFFAEGAV